MKTELEDAVVAGVRVILLNLIFFHVDLCIKRGCKACRSLNERERAYGEYEEEEGEMGGSRTVA